MRSHVDETQAKPLYSAETLPFAAHATCPCEAGTARKQTIKSQCIEAVLILFYVKSTAALAYLYDDRVPTPTARRLRFVIRALIEVAFILFLFYANLLMGEFTHSGDRGNTLAVALRDIVTIKNFGIGLFSAIVGYIGFEHLRSKL